MPDKILSAISPAYGIATGSGPYRNLLGVFGRKIFDKQKQRRENKEASEAKSLDEILDEIGIEPYKPKRGRKR